LHGDYLRLTYNCSWDAADELYLNQMRMGLVVLLRLIFNKLRTQNEGIDLISFLVFHSKTYKLGICEAHLPTEIPFLSFF
jgi:hypothetical protein